MNRWLRHHRYALAVALRRLLSGLRAAGFVGSEKGHGGGWVISCPRERITLRDIHEALGAPALSASSPADPTRWDEALRAWASVQLERGQPQLHAHALERFERALLDAALAHTGGRRTEAAARLGLGRNTVTRKLGASRKRR